MQLISNFFSDLVKTGSPSNVINWRFEKTRFCWRSELRTVATLTKAVYIPCNAPLRPKIYIILIITCKQQVIALRSPLLLLRQSILPPRVKFTQPKRRIYSGLSSQRVSFSRCLSSQKHCSVSFCLSLIHRLSSTQRWL